MEFTILKRSGYLILAEQVYLLIQPLVHLQWDESNPMTVITTNLRLASKSIHLFPNTCYCNSLKHHHLCFGIDALWLDKASASSMSSKFIKGRTNTVISIIILKLPLKSNKEEMNVKKRTALPRKRGKKKFWQTLQNERVNTRPL